MKYYLLAAMLFTSIWTAAQTAASQKKTIKLSINALQDKIKGGWAGQTIGVTFGGPYEFRFNGTYIQEYQPLDWYDGYLKKTMLNSPGLYDDIYMDLTFVEVFERLGLDAPVDSFAAAYANAGYMLWHANQAGRYNILNGIKAPHSGHWKNNPHADDIDYQIESDFAGLMCPGMPNSASAISDKIGHIMNYGDGWYGGVYVGAMYTLAFSSSNIVSIVKEALNTIPAQSEFYKCISDVIQWHQQYPDDWHRTWFLIQRKWSSEIGCPDGVFNAFNIDAKINAAYVVLGLLYGKGDFGKTVEIATRAGQDADCNPSTAAGIVGTMLGYSKIPAYWKMGLTEAEDILFKYTSTSLNKVYDMSYRHALQLIQKNGGRVEGDQITIVLQIPKPVAYERSFGNLYPVKKISLGNDNVNELTFEMEGEGFVLRGSAYCKQESNPPVGVVPQLELFIDGPSVEKIRLPAEFTTRRHDLCWKYDLSPGKHTITVKVTGVSQGCGVRASDCIVYKSKKSQ